MPLQPGPWARPRPRDEGGPRRAQTGVGWPRPPAQLPLTPAAAVSPGRGTIPDGRQDRRNSQRVAGGERRNGPAGMSRTEGTDGPCPSGNGALLGPFPPRCRQGFAFGSGAAAGERQEMGSRTSHPPQPLPPPASRVASGSAAASRVFFWEGGVLGSGFLSG